MARNVFDNSMVAHVWANGTQNAGRSNNGNFYFEGRTLFSYGRHFAVGYRGPKNRPLLTTENYSISTSRHKREAWRAAVNAIDVPDLTPLARSLDASPNDLAFGLGCCEAHVREHATAFEAGHAAALLALYGMPESKAGAFVARAKKDAAKAAAKAEADAAKAKIAGHIHAAKRYAAMTDSEWREHVNAACRSTYVGRKRNWTTGESTIVLRGDLPSLVRDLGRAKAAAKRARMPRIAATVWTRLKALRALINRPDLESVLSRKKGHSSLSHIVRLVRAGLDGLANGRKFRNAHQMTQWAIAAENLTKRAPRLVPLIEGANHAARILRERERVAHELEMARIAAERAEREKQAREDWFAGKPSRWGGRDEMGRAYIRAVGVTRDAAGHITGGTLQTSQGADVPLTHAVKAFRFIKLCRDAGRTWRANGHTIRVGHFRVDSVTATGDMVAGCHRFAWSEIERLARELGVFDQAASDSALELSH